MSYTCFKEQSDAALDVEQDGNSPGQSRVMVLPRKRVSIELVVHCRLILMSMASCFHIHHSDLLSSDSQQGKKNLRNVADTGKAELK